MPNANLDTLTYADLKAKEKQLLDDLEIVQDMLVGWQRLFGKVKEDAPNRDNSIPIKKVAKTSLEGKNAHDATVILVLESGNPLKTKEVLSQFKNRGKNSESKDPITSLYNGLDGAVKRQDSQLIKLGGGYWGLKGRDENWKSPESFI